MGDRPKRIGPANNVDAPEAILADSPDAALDALLRRHGGKPLPKPINGRVVLPPIGKRNCKDQQELFADDPEGE